MTYAEKDVPGVPHIASFVGSLLRLRLHVLSHMLQDLARCPLMSVAVVNPDAVYLPCGVAVCVRNSRGQTFGTWTMHSTTLSSSSSGVLSEGWNADVNHVDFASSEVLPPEEALIAHYILTHYGVALLPPGDVKRHIHHFAMAVDSAATISIAKDF